MNQSSQNPPSVADIERSPANIPVVSHAVPREMYNGLLSRFTEVSDEKVALQERFDKLQQDASAAIVLNKLMEPYASKAFWFMCGYSGFVGVALLLSGFRLWQFSIDAEVLKFLVGSTAVTVIGLVGMVLTGIFVGARKA